MASKYETRKKRNCSEFTRMVSKLYHATCENETAISLKACEALSDIIKQFVRKVVVIVNDLLLASKHMQVHPTSKILPAINLLFPKIDPVSLLPLYNQATILDELLSYAGTGVSEYKKTDAKHRKLFIRPSRVRRLMERGLVLNKKVIHTETGTRTTRTSISEISPIFLAYVIQSFILIIFREASVLMKQERRMTLKLNHIHRVIRTNLELVRFFSSSLIVGGGVMPTIHSAKIVV